MIGDVFVGEGAGERLRARLTEAKDGGADVAVLPEIACNPWSPATKTPRDDDAEPLGGPRCTMQAQAALDIGMPLLGSAIIESQGHRHNTCLLWESDGSLQGTYRKHHVPHEPGFWETCHYEPAPDSDLITPIPFRGHLVGVQICSDMNRPQGTHLLAAAEADLVIGPRSTEAATYDRWRPVWIANAITSACYVCSVNRPGPENGVPIGGGSIAVAPDGEVLIETDDPISIFTIERSRLEQAKIDYPGYLPVRSTLYAANWADLLNKE